MTWRESSRKKYLTPQELESWSKQVREKGKTIATLNGSFDILHAGHLEILYQASLQADVLLVALNSDDSIKTYKGPNRPVIALDYRMQMIAALEFVDFVTFFHETDPINLILTVRPHVHVNGGEYGHDCVESKAVKEVGGKLFLVDRIEGLSTSKVIENAIRCNI